MCYRVGIYCWYPFHFPSGQNRGKSKVEIMSLVSSHLSFLSLVSFYLSFLYLWHPCFHFVSSQVYIFVHITLQKQVHDYSMCILAQLDPGKHQACLHLLLNSGLAACFLEASPQETSAGRWLYSGGLQSGEKVDSCPKTNSEDSTQPWKFLKGVSFMGGRQSLCYFPLCRLPSNWLEV